MGRFGGAPALPAYEEDEDLFETSSSVSGDEAQLSDGEAQEQSKFGLQVAPKTARRLNSDTSAYDMSSVKAELPAKRGLSRYYDGKSQSFACMSEVRCLEDLRKKIRPCKSHVDLDGENQDASPASGPNGKGVGKPSSGSSCANLMARNAAAAGMLYRPPPISVSKNAYHQ